MRRLVAVLLWIVAAGCLPDVGPEGKEVGRNCRRGEDCDEICITLSTVGGICSMRCVREADCPPQSRCVQISGLDDAHCLPACETDDTCAGYNRGLLCDPLPSIIGQSSKVCFLPGGSAMP
jgi:hypothetical protein